MYRFSANKPYLWRWLWTFVGNESRSIDECVRLWNMQNLFWQPDNLLKPPKPIYLNYLFGFILGRLYGAKKLAKVCVIFGRTPSVRSRQTIKFRWSLANNWITLWSSSSSRMNVSISPLHSFESNRAKAHFMKCIHLMFWLNFTLAKFDESIRQYISI